MMRVAAPVIAEIKPADKATDPRQLAWQGVMDIHPADLDALSEAQFRAG